VLDYHPGQTASIERDFGVVAHTFPIGLKRDVYATREERCFDVCIVGGQTPRRAVVAKLLARAGCRLSPATGSVLEEVAARSKVVMNVHAFRSSNIEFPRIVSALTSGAALVTEEAEGMAGYFPSHIYISASYAGIVEAVTTLLSCTARSDRLAIEAATWMGDIYLPRADKTWRELVPMVLAQMGRFSH
jgi:hypothetical protein